MDKQESSGECTGIAQGLADAKPIPRFRGKSRVNSKGVVETHYFWDGRGQGLGTYSLGKDRERAIELWGRCEQGLLPLPRKKPRVTSQRTRRAPRTFSWGAWKGIPKWARRLYINSQARARVTYKSFTITPAYFAEIVARADGRCQVSGIPFDLSGAEKRSQFAPSLDRIDSAVGYEPGNIRLVCHIANVAMNSWGLESLLTFARALCAHCAEDHSTPVNTDSGAMGASVGASLARKEPND